MSAVALPVQYKPETQRPEVILETLTHSSGCNYPGPKASIQRSIVGGGELSGVRSPASEVRRSQPLTPNTQSPIPVLVGRDAELTRLQNVLGKALQGKRQVMFVSGEAGIGKTALVDAFLTQNRDRTDVRITSGQCVEHYGPGKAYLPLLEATQRLCRGPGRERRIEGLKRYAPSWLVHLPGLLDPEDRARLQQRVQGASRERMLREMAEAAELFGTQHALVVVLEDLHWSDVATLDWLTYMARRREPAKLMILGTYRPADVSAGDHPLRAVVQELASRNCCEEIRVAPLSEQSVSEYLACRFGHSVAASTLPGLVHQRTGGNPLFVVSVADDLLQQGIIREEAGSWQVHGDHLRITERVPDTLRQIIGQQVERLPVAAQHLLEIASVVGVDFSAAVVAAGLQATVEEVDRQCEALARQGQFIHAHGVEEWPDGTLSARYSFRHAVYQAVLAERVSEAQKVCVLRRVGERKALAYGERAREIVVSLNEPGGSVKTREERQKAPQTDGSGQKTQGPSPFSPSGFQPAAASLAGDLVLNPQSLPPPVPSPQPPVPNTFRHDGKYWTLGFAGTTCRLKDARGLHHLARLLRQPHREVHVLTLITSSENLNEESADIPRARGPGLPFDHSQGCGDAGTILDPQARAAYKQRVSELREELAEAQRFHDLGRSEHLAAELDFLTHELAGAAGLDGWARRLGLPAERARVNISRTVKLALHKISEHHPALGQHLAPTVKTGTYCSYTPDVRMPISWQV